MRLISIDYEPVFYVEFSVYEVEVLRACSDSHYDHKCKALNQPGGLVYGLYNMVMFNETGEPVRWNLKLRDIDTLRKTLEMSAHRYPRTGPCVYWGLTKLLSDLASTPNQPAKPI